MDRKKYYPTAGALYFTYFILGIASTIMGQFKQNFAALWGAEKLADGSYDVSSVVTVIAAIGLGRLIAFPIAGPFSDRFGRKKSAVVGMIFYAIFFLGIPFSRSVVAGYVLILCAGIANSFLDTAVTPSCMEIFSEKGAVANLFTKFAVSLGQFLLPILILFVNGNGMSPSVLFISAAVLVIADTILLAVLPFPQHTTAAAGSDKKEKQKFKITPALVLLTCIGFTASATFMIFMNTNQELGTLYGLTKPHLIQSFYSVGIVSAVLLTSVFISKGLKPTRVLMIYPSVAILALLMMYLVRLPQICLLGGFLIGFFAAGGVLQLATSTANEMYPERKGLITALIMFASSGSNYIVLNVAGYLSKIGGTEGPRYILLFNMAITAVGIVLAIILNIHLGKQKEEATCQ